MPGNGRRKPRKPPGPDCPEGRRARSAAEDEPHVVAVEGRSGSEFLQHSTEVTDAHGHQFCDFDLTVSVRAFRYVLSHKARHGISEPEIPGFGVVRGHSHALFGSGMEFVEKMRIDSDSGGDHKITCSGISLEIGISNATERDTAWHGVQGPHWARHESHAKSK